MSEEEAIQILKIRAQIFSLNPNKRPKLPLSESFIRELYRNSSGEIRLLFHICDAVVRDVIKEYPSVELINDNEAKRSLKPIVAKMIGFDSIPRSKKDLLRTLLETPLRPKDYKQAKCKSAVDFTNQMKTLVSVELVAKRQEGSAVFYHASGRTQLASYCGLFE